MTTEARTREQPAREGASGAQRARRLRLLVVEDDEAFRELLVSELGRDGDDVVGMACGRDVLRWLCDAVCNPKSVHLPDLVVSDLRMPGMSGLELLATLRAGEWSVPYILVTAFADERTVSDATRFGATVVLSKPVDIDSLRAAIRVVSTYSVE